MRTNRHQRRILRFCCKPEPKSKRRPHPPRKPLTVGSHSDEGGGREEQDEDHVAAEEEPAQRGEVVEPGGCVRVQRLVEERLEVSLPAEGPDGPQALQRDDEVGEDGAASCGGGGSVSYLAVWYESHVSASQ